MAKVIKDNIEFDSKMEADAYQLLLDCQDIEIISMQTEFPLMDGFYMPNILTKPKKIQDMKYSCDFIVKVSKLSDIPVVIEISGYVPSKIAFALRKKIFMDKYKDQYYFEEFKSIKALKEWIKKLEEKDNNG